MSDVAVDRRKLLAGAFGAGALGALVRPRGAAAFQVEPASPAVSALMNAHCEAVSTHEQLVRDLLVRFAALGQEEAAARVRAMSCPICGCSLAAAVPAAPSPPSLLPEGGQ